MSSIVGVGNYIENTLSLAKSNQGVKNASDLQSSIESSLYEKNISDVEQKAREFEAVFINQMLNIMFESLEPDAVFGGGKTEEIFQSFLVEEYSESISQSGGIGIADHITKQLLTLQEV